MPGPGGCRRETSCAASSPAQHRLTIRLSLWASLSCLQDCYILDQGGLKIYVWKGKKANAQERKEALSQALVGMGLGGRTVRRVQQGEGSRVRQGHRGQRRLWA